MLFVQSLGAGFLLFLNDFFPVFLLLGLCESKIINSKTFFMKVCVLFVRKNLTNAKLVIIYDGLEIVQCLVTDADTVVFSSFFCRVAM